MFKKTIITAAIVGVTALAAAGAANAHSNGYKHAHNTYGNHVKVNKKKLAKKKAVKNKRFADYGPKHGNKHKSGPYFKRAGFPPYIIRQTLRARGFRKIQFRDRQLPLYVVKACKRGHKFIVGVNRWGKVVWKRPRGYCGPRNF